MGELQLHIVSTLASCGPNSIKLLCHGYSNELPHIGLGVQKFGCAFATRDFSYPQTVG